MDRLPGVFSLTDLLAYHFPGFLGASAIVLMRDDWFTTVTGFGAKNPVLFAVVAVVLPFVFGVLISAVTHLLGPIANGGWLTKNEILEPVALCEAAIRSELGHLIGKEQEQKLTALDKFSVNLPAFYLCRAVIRDHLPRTYVTVDRQNTLRQFRRNLLIPIALSGVAALLVVGRNYSLLVHSAWLIPLTLLLMISTIRSISLSRQREMREVFLAFLVVSRFPTREMDPQED